MEKVSDIRDTKVDAQSTNQSVSQSINQLVYRSVRQLVSWSVN